MARKKKEVIDGVWVTKYALTQGIIYYRTGEEGSSPDMVCVGESYMDYYHKGEWFKSFGEARQNAEGKRERAIASLTKKLAKVRCLTFESENVVDLS